MGDFNKMRLLPVNTFWMLLTMLTIFSVIWLLPGAGDKSAAGLSDTEVDRLFQEAGVIRMPPLPPPADIELPDMSGKTVRVSDFEGKIVFVTFWATWCPPCREETRALEKLYRKFKNSDLSMITADLQESEATVRKYLDRNDLTFPVLLDSDGKYGTLFGVRAIPTTFILDRKGGIIGNDAIADTTFLFPAMVLPAVLALLVVQFFLKLYLG